MNNNDSPLLYSLDLLSFKQALPNAINKTAKSVSAQISIPNRDGKLELFSVSESSNFESELQSKYPDIRAYEGMGITDKKARLSFSVSPKGIQTIVLRADNETEFIESYPDDKSLYVLFSSNERAKGTLPLICKTDDIAVNNDLLKKTAKISSNNKVFKTLRLALSCTGEYARYFGGENATVADALEGMNATMTRVNAIFNRDLAIKLNLIASNDLIIYTNPSTDPYSDSSTLENWSLELQNTVTTIIGNSGYDIGHVFGASGGGGNAGCIGCVCVNPSGSDPYGKGSAYTSPGNGKPEGEAFDIDYVIHEMGHQLGANHTFSYSIEGTGVNVEPGSGSTIMGYAGVSDGYDIQVKSDDYFAYASILQIQNNLNTKTCPVSTVITNTPPTIDAGQNYTIPKGTAFILKGTGSDSDGDVVTYCWEQNDSATSSDKENSLAISTKSNGPLFRSIKPGSSAIRYMPSYKNVLANRLTSSWESVSTVARTLHFVLTGRDNASMGTAQTNSDEKVITVSGNIGPFSITSLNTDDLYWAQGSDQTITWSVNNSNSLAGASNVNIKLSYDNGLTFPVNLALNTPNDGSETIIVPNVKENNCRVLIEPVDNIFYAVNSKAFSIGYTVDYSCSSYNYQGQFAIPESATYTTRNITYPTTSGLVSDVDFNVSFTHSFVSDVQMEIISPQGTTVKLFDRGCSDINDSLVLKFDDSGSELQCGTSSLQTVVPVGNLSDFNGENPSGIWKFRIRDAFEEDNGTLHSAAISICEKNFVLKQPEFRILDFFVFTNPNNGTFKVKFTGDSTSTVQIKIHDLLGRLVFKNEYPKTVLFDEVVQIPNPKSGFYFLEVIVADKKVIKKILVE
ncbi:reprolysin-like metallopeptidase [Flavobacterium sp.]|uniref:reprolysin-like metallopeptidase n=1 Tax=Flavobacterium sp. TaxID=239 RepID=UPI003C66030B